MAEGNNERNPFAFNIRGNLIAGLLALAPLIAVWLVFDFLLDLLFQAGRPLARAIAGIIESALPELTPVLDDATVEWLIAVFGALLVLYAIGAVTSRVVGIRLMGMFERLIARIPLVE